MNTACPTCGAVYNVAAKDIGRKLKCKKCSTALKVTEDGLELDGGTGASDPKPAPVPAAVEEDEEDEEDEAPRRKKTGKSYDRGPRPNPFAAINGALTAVGGIPTLLFGFGVFLVIVFTSFPIIGTAGTERANANVEKLTNELKVKKDALAPKNKKPSDWSDADRKAVQEGAEKLDEEYSKRIKEAALSAESTKIDNRRDVWYEMYGLMFGFLFVAFGCIGYLRTEQPLVLKIVAAVILCFMMMMMFMKFGGCSVPK
ncbi:MJ0042-type zinc finger domain-containing protein [Frigoriglobus tundricola]|uniref:Zinc finger/thioredoxin putative domain-containing protein n=1 Tax=Frigoriglobus tundricola TaxID=2774151 RepID=A0A6M5Z133_9BACT|nr:MJ0042-type zinc finger domain-containing protein [Frigoriglobus tundricola]QJW98922.1 hypothetical protein FTUN_6517 [Frigoriglobus tundricola]